ncbi:GIY-YIG nuclease family protein [Leptospira bandrabouensis]|uniref:GIY-YIG nuclease family protein n=1 Tax=Leptospira bandrabouensis TaxID=2484903 RepID=UPI001EE96659|nr:GIY-YIG nuclease family protein [Leptospira bandrabouensis]MCG6146630.1 GIY-YIG nuclease family protein [Leptospira bandrabouensis]MCG6162003.1 GIY-YIG nuclease family protein [Leptospira bandrabouensis]MCG6166208.1 GIY-YIG nuclease family protein [Leptospira bandrabouensis]
MRSFKPEYDEKTKWLCLTGFVNIGEKDFANQEDCFIGIPLDVADTYSAEELYSRVCFYIKQVEALKLYDIMDSFQVYINQNASIKTLKGYIELATKVKENGIDLEFNISIDMFIARCQIKIEDLEEKNIQIEKQNRIKKAKAEDKGFIYILKSEFGYKIGKTKKPKERHAHFTVKLPFNFEKVFEIEVIGYHQREKDLHDLYNVKRINGEWFNLTESDLIKIKEFLFKYIPV